MFSKELEVTISEAYQEARTQRHEFLTVEHLLLALLDNSAAVSVLKACNADLEKLRAELRQVISETVPELGDEDSRDTQPTIGFQRVLQRALYHVQSSGKQEVTGTNVLIAIFSEKELCPTADHIDAMPDKFFEQLLERERLWSIADQRKQDHRHCCL